MGNPWSAVGVPRSAGPKVNAGRSFSIAQRPSVRQQLALLSATPGAHAADVRAALAVCNGSAPVGSGRGHARQSDLGRVPGRFDGRRSARRVGCCGSSARARRSSRFLRSSRTALCRGGLGPGDGHRRRKAAVSITAVAITSHRAMRAPAGSRRRKSLRPLGQQSPEGETGVLAPPQHKPITIGAAFEPFTRSDPSPDRHVVQLAHPAPHIVCTSDLVPGGPPGTRLGTHKLWDGVGYRANSRNAKPA